MSKEEKKVFNCDRCGVECHYDNEYPYCLCYKCNREQLAEKEAENENLIEILKKIESKNNANVNRIIREYEETFKERIAEKEEILNQLNYDNTILIQQLTEKDEMLANLERRDKANTNADKFLVQFITKQVCEKIRDETRENLLQIICKCGKETDFDFINYEYLIKLLDQIEK